MYDIIASFLSNFIPVTSILVPITVALIMIFIILIIFKLIGGRF